MRDGVPQPRKAAPAPPRIFIQYPAPAVDRGRFPAKRTAGDTVRVEADVFRDGHDLLRAVARYRGPGDRSWREAEMHPVDAAIKGVRWATEIVVDRMGAWEYTIEAFTDVFATWRDELARKVAAGQHDLSGEISEGVLLLRDALTRAKKAPDKKLIEHALRTLEDPDCPEEAKHDVALGPELFAAMERAQERKGAATLEAPVTIEVDRERARFGSWYELFPRSFGGFKGVQAQLPRLAELGFDVLYLPPIHPIGETNRKGRNTPEFPGGNPVAQAGEPGSPWAIGKLGEGGHEAVHPELGTIEDMRELCAAAAGHGIDIAIDLAIQASADHPWLTEHPEWFHRRPDGTLKFAENPPKKYQDIYNLNWDTPDWKGLWQALRDIVVGWVELGVKVFRVDNPHTKPFPFWEWLIKEVHAVDRDVIFLSEAFTRRAVMRHLAKIGFTQSYTYFTWKNHRWELVEYLSELAHGPEREYFRPNFFANTQDILHEYLVHGGEPAFAARLVLAATLSPTYGIYSGFENFENVPVKEGSEEYMDSEKYEIKQRTLDGPLLPMVQRINEVRRENPALQHLDNITFLDTHNDALLAYLKRTGSNVVVCIVNLDPHHAQEGVAVVPAHAGLPPAFHVEDQLTGEMYDWRIGPNFVRLEPPLRQAHVMRVR
jgi:starch synthase (maltosyl-transferring)